MQGKRLNRNVRVIAGEETDLILCSGATVTLVSDRESHVKRGLNIKLYIVTESGAGLVFGGLFVSYFLNP